MTFGERVTIYFGLALLIVASLLAWNAFDITIRQMHADGYSQRVGSESTTDATFCQDRPQNPYCRELHARVLSRSGRSR